MRLRFSNMSCRGLLLGVLASAFASISEIGTEQPSLLSQLIATPCAVLAVGECGCLKDEVEAVNHLRVLLNAHGFVLDSHQQREQQLLMLIFIDSRQSVPCAGLLEGAAAHANRARYDYNFSSDMQSAGKGEAILQIKNG